MWDGRGRKDPRKQVRRSPTGERSKGTSPLSGRRRTGINHLLRGNREGGKAERIVDTNNLQVPFGLERGAKGVSKPRKGRGM